MALLPSMCLALVLSLTGAFAFPALIPSFMDAWSLTNTEAGWIAGIYMGIYALASPVLIAMTDRIDARGLFLAGTMVTAVASIAFALFAEGFWSALALRAVAGIGLAGTYIPGLRILVDRWPADDPSPFTVPPSASGPRYPTWWRGSLADGWDGRRPSPAPA